MKLSEKTRKFFIFSRIKGIIMGWHNSSHRNVNTELSNAETAISVFRAGYEEANALASQSSSLASTIFFSIKRNPSATEASKELGTQLMLEIQDANAFINSAKNCYKNALDTTQTAKDALLQISSELTKGRAYRSNHTSGTTLMEAAAEHNRDINVAKNGINGMAMHDTGYTAPSACNRASRTLERVATQLGDHLSVNK